MNRLRIGQVAAQASVSVDTVRYYERRGLVQNVERDGSGYRRYGLEAVDRIRTIRRAAAIGFSLDQLETIFRMRASGKPPCGSVLEMARRKLSDLDEQIATLNQLRSVLETTISSWGDRLQQTPTGGLAHLLDSLGNNGDKS